MTFRFSRSQEKEAKIRRELEEINVPQVLDPMNIGSRLH
jgi:hypothetical protein